MTCWQQFASRVKRELVFYKRVAAHPRTPAASRHLLGCAIGYALLPFDLIPDAIPVLGHLDDAVIVPGLIWLALRRVPRDVIAECRAAEEIQSTVEIDRTLSA
jgi:uncharacterized membrane protein YkvA (DUF1232 family)